VTPNPSQRSFFEHMRQFTASQLSEWLADETRTKPVLLDVREPWEFETCRIAGSQSMPMRSIPARYLDLNRDQDVVVICHHGARSFHAGMFLEQMNFSSVINLQGGLAAWARDVDPAMPTY
jgi:rhodanese-related sulfurtransferase